MLDLITTVNDALNGFIWGVPAMTCILGVGLYLAIRTRFLPIRKFGYAMKNTFGKMFQKLPRFPGVAVEKFAQHEVNMVFTTEIDGFFNHLSGNSGVFVPMYFQNDEIAESAIDKTL